MLLGDIVQVPTQRALVRDGYSQFDEFWSYAVRKEAKTSARRAYAKAIQETDPQIILDAWIRHNKIWETWPQGDKKWIWHPSRWLNEEAWDGNDPEFRGGGVVANLMSQMTEEEAMDAAFGGLMPDWRSQIQANAAITDIGDTASHLEGR